MKYIALILTALFISIRIGSAKFNDTSEEYKSYYYDYAKWECLYQAIATVESGNNPKAVGSRGDGGIIQILPKGSGGYLDEANRLLKEDKYADKDRFCPVKSREIWNTVMKHRNPKRDIKRAIKLHNPRAGKSYYYKVIKVYYNLLISNKLTIN